MGSKFCISGMELCLSGAEGQVYFHIVLTLKNVQIQKVTEQYKLTDPPSSIPTGLGLNKWIMCQSFLINNHNSHDFNEPIITRKLLMSVSKGPFLGGLHYFTNLFIHLSVSAHPDCAWISLIKENLFCPKKIQSCSQICFLEIWKIQKMSLSATPTHNLQECGGQCWREAILIYCEICKCPSNFSICTTRGLFQIFIQLLWISFL